MASASRVTRTVATAGLMLAAACGNGGTTRAIPGDAPPGVAGSSNLPASQPAADATGHTYLSTSVTVDGEPRPLVDGSRIRLVIDERSVGADAGCNSLGGEYEMDGDRLVVNGLAMTEMGCDPALMEQEDWLVDLLTAGPVLALDGDRLTLTSGDTVVSLVDEESVVADRPLRGTRWVLESYGGSEPDDPVSSVPVGVTWTLGFGATHAEADYGCNTGNYRYRLGGSTMRLDSLGSTYIRCPTDLRAVETTVSRVLSADPVWRIEGDVLTLTSPAGTLTYRAGR